MASQTISLRAAFAEAEKIGIPATSFNQELIRAARIQFLPAAAAYWVKVRLAISPGDSLRNALRGTNLSPRLDNLQQQEAFLRSKGVSRHWYQDRYYTLVFSDTQWLLYYISDSWASGRQDIFQSYWDMDVYIDESRWQIIFEDLVNFTRFEVSHIDFELRSIKRVWENLGPILKSPLGRPPGYTFELEQATKWARQNRFAQISAYKEFVQSLRPYKQIPKETMRRLFMPIWRENADND